MSELVRIPEMISRERRALVALVEPSAVAEAERRIAAIAELGKRAGLAAPVVNEATFLRAEALEQLAGLVDEGQARGEIATPVDTLKKGAAPVSRTSANGAKSIEEVGVDHRRVAEGRALARTGAVAAVRDDPNRHGDKLVSMGELLKQAKRREREDARRAQTAEREAVARAELERDPARGIPDLVHADVTDWRPSGVASIITDPPYVGDAIPLYGALRDFALAVLPVGGALVVMTAHWLLADVVHALRHDRLVFRTVVAWRYVNSERVLDQPRRVFPCWKPILVYHLDAMPPDTPVLRGEITSAAPDKDNHAWGQSLDGFERLVAGVTAPGELVCDPFLGGGTTAIAALAQGRRFAGCDTNADAVATTRARLWETR